MKYSRNKLQELIVLCLYQYLFYYNDENRPSVVEIIESIVEMDIQSADPFLKKVIKLAIEHAQDAVSDISLYLKDWKFDRLNLVEQAILLSSYTQFKYMEQPRQIAINVAVELAKKYGDDESYKFINGVLDKCLV